MQNHRESGKHLLSPRRSVVYMSTCLLHVHERNLQWVDSEPPILVPRIDACGPCEPRRWISVALLRSTPQLATTTG